MPIHTEEQNLVFSVSGQKDLIRTLNKEHPRGQHKSRLPTTVPVRLWAIPSCKWALPWTERSREREGERRRMSLIQLIRSLAPSDSLFPPSSWEETLISGCARTPLQKRAHSSAKPKAWHLGWGEWEPDGAAGVVANFHLLRKKKNKKKRGLIQSASSFLNRLFSARTSTQCEIIAPPFACFFPSAKTLTQIQIGRLNLIGTTPS